MNSNEYEYEREMKQQVFDDAKRELRKFMDEKRLSANDLIKVAASVESENINALVLARASAIAAERVESDDFDSMINSLIDALVIYETWSPEKIMMKLSEEVGELSEQVFVNMGAKNKVLDEDIEHETADVINSAIATYIRVLTLRGRTPTEIKQRLVQGMKEKNAKYLRNLKR